MYTHENAGCTHFDLCLKTCDAIHRTRRWTTLPTPRAPPCRNVSPESKETRFERHPTADLRRDLSLAYSAGLCASSVPQAASLREGEFYAHSATFGITSLIPKTFQNQSFEAEEAAKELTIQAAKKIKAEEKAKQVATKSAASKQTKVPNTKQKIHQKPAKDKKNTKQTMASAPAKEDAP
eukprot:scaffold71377_cov65-Phaeocystis_antarctica.AAC.1